MPHNLREQHSDPRPPTLSGLTLIEREFTSLSSISSVLSLSLCNISITQILFLSLSLPRSALEAFIDRRHGSLSLSPSTDQLHRCHGYHHHCRSPSPATSIYLLTYPSLQATSSPPTTAARNSLKNLEETLRSALAGDLHAKSKLKGDIMHELRCHISPPVV